jgi:hypothetical protein
MHAHKQAEMSPATLNQLSAQREALTIDAHVLIDVSSLRYNVLY